MNINSSFIKENLVLIAGITLPLLLVALFGIARMVSTISVDAPTFKAVYAEKGYYYGSGEFKYSITETGQLKAQYVTNQTQPASTTPSPATTTIYIYDPVQNNSQTYKLEFNNQYQSSPTETNLASAVPTTHFILGNTAPDGYAYKYNNSHYNNGLIPEIFGYGHHYYDGRYAIGKNGRNFYLPHQQRYQEIEFIGWTQ